MSTAKKYLIPVGYLKKIKDYAAAWHTKREVEAHFKNVGLTYQMLLENQDGEALFVESSEVKQCVEESS